MPLPAAHRLSATGVFGLRWTSIGWPTRNASGRERPRLDQVDELVALLEAVDHRRRVLGRGGDEIDLCGEIGGAIVAGDAHGVADRKLRQLGLRHEEAQLHVAGRHDREHRPLRRHHLALAEIDLLDRAGDRRKPLRRAIRVCEVPPAPRRRARRRRPSRDWPACPSRSCQRSRAIVGLLRIRQRRLVLVEIGKLEIVVDGIEVIADLDLVALADVRAWSHGRPRPG